MLLTIPPVSWATGLGRRHTLWRGGHLRDGRLLESLSTQRLVADPGAYSVYCNDGFTLAELVVAAVSGLDFMDYVDKYILDPSAWTIPSPPAATLT